MEQLMIQAGMERPLECFAAQSGMLSHDGESFGGNQPPLAACLVQAPAGWCTDKE
ncbi:hypothetical protein MGG_17184 [Pyricularia oryzae 70-15]|uniref:Uncharacterized protein n=2 Tax=Pyricularia oryzae TaxID=318829 RepID=G4N7H7_PYRO7|nr:uncharacterized protein MGG_17184 [Pyricularia oryzae 70-15]EHA50834.1 hypothetical protein MGG_17184 [Pyricularia oryzae 70-15]